mmetsp:Transcript_18808/g.30374  ORF Transcript_18808/g.30374 Transcript_18808/m.30374 type:complete len:214 (-) Transcript_18808:650-1291(-)
MSHGIPLPGRRPDTSWFLPLSPGTMPSHWGHTSGCEGSGPSTRPPRLALRLPAPSGQLRAAPRRRRRWRGPSRSRGGPRQRRAAPAPLITPPSCALEHLCESRLLGGPAVRLYTDFFHRQNLTHLCGAIITCLVTITMDAHSSLADLICCLLLRSSSACPCKMAWLVTRPAFQYAPSLGAVGLQVPLLPTDQAFQLLCGLLATLSYGNSCCLS